MIKLVILLKKRADMSHDDFRRYYEDHHSKLNLEIPYVRRYFRRYLTPIATPSSEGVGATNFDVMAELWFDNRQDIDRAMAFVAETDLAVALRQDEENLFDRKKSTFYLVEEFETDRATGANFRVP
ncbi:conserved hypothetical protein [Sphingobium faniae]|nr:conserved hypothetical protein [Sphingobium faniae]